MEETRMPYLEVTAGPDTGRRFALPEGVTTIGRSSECGIVLKDPLLSRRHCNVTRHGDEISISDLDSANGTFVNGKETKTATLGDGAEISIGDSAIRLAAMAEAPSAAADGAPIVDLGLGTGGGDAPEAARPNWRPLLWAVAAVAVVATAASFILRGGTGPEEPVITQPAAPDLLPLQIAYEKVEADAENIFRYNMELSPDGLLSIEIDDLAEGRHVRKEAQIAEEGIRRLARQLERAGMFSIETPAAGISPNGGLTRMCVSIVAGRRVACATAENRAPQPAFSAVCDTLETFGRNELGIWAMQYPTEKLVELAQEAFTRARNLFDQRGIAHGNLYLATKSCQEAMFYLETVEPKPAFFAEMLETMQEAGEELSRRYGEQRFRADRAINLREWQAAAEELRILRELIPDEDDQRNADATRKLLDVENRLKRKK
ncbi:MAG: FHA domain-containing protein [Kiritimatiellae bacterium]|nr:FHA domain-containing protein [Kiritimatiellia bacterium]